MNLGAILAIVGFTVMGYAASGFDFAVLCLGLALVIAGIFNLLSNMDR